jgi:hypothetical protein
MTGNLRRRLDNLDSQIEERRSVPKKDIGSLSVKELVRIANWIYIRGLRPDATEKQKEGSRVIAKMFPTLRY